MKLKLIFNVVLFLLILFAAFLLYKSIQEPIAFKEELTDRTNAVVQKLIKVRDAQKLYFEVTEEYADSWEALRDSLKYGSIRVEKIIGDPDDPDFTGEVIREIVEVPVGDTVKAMGWGLDSLKYVPYGNGATFDIIADTITYKQTTVNVVEVGTPYESFMGPYADIKFSKYDDSYNPKKKLKFGDLTKPSLAGSWDRAN